MSKITDIIVFGNPSDKSYLTTQFHQSCTDDELVELYDTLYGWTTLSLYSNEYKKTLRKAMQSINKIQKQRTKQKHKKVA